MIKLLGAYFLPDHLARNCGMHWVFWGVPWHRAVIERLNYVTYRLRWRQCDWLEACVAVVFGVVSKRTTVSTCFLDTPVRISIWPEPDTSWLN